MSTSRKMQSGRSRPRKQQWLLYNKSWKMFSTSTAALFSVDNACRKVQRLALTNRKEQCGQRQPRKELSGWRLMSMAAFFLVDSRQPSYHAPVAALYLKYILKALEKLLFWVSMQEFNLSKVLYETCKQSITQLLHPPIHPSSSTLFT